MKKRNHFFLVAIIIALSLSLFYQPKIHAADKTETEDDRIAVLEQQISELKIEMEKLKGFIESTNAPSSVDYEIGGESELDSRAWTSPLMGWEADYTNDWLYALNNVGGVDNVNVGIGTNNPLTPFHLVGDFYNQGFDGVKSNYNPGVVSWSNVATVTITTHGTGVDNSVVLLFAHVQDYTDAAYMDMFVRVIRDGGTVVAMGNGAGCVSMYGSGFMGATIVTYDEPSAGTHTYTLQIESVLAPARGYNFFAIELKR